VNLCSSGILAALFLVQDNGGEQLVLWVVSHIISCTGY
jgi:hypothetical protein